MFLFLRGEIGRASSELCGCIQGICFTGMYEALLSSKESSLFQIENTLKMAKLSANEILAMQPTNAAQNFNCRRTDEYLFIDIKVIYTLYACMYVYTHTCVDI